MVLCSSHHSVAGGKAVRHEDLMEPSVKGAPERFCLCSIIHGLPFKLTSSVMETFLLIFIHATVEAGPLSARPHDVKLVTHEVWTERIIRSPVECRCVR
jgi:hypothetical protein